MNEISYNCLIVDDEPIAIRVIKNHLTGFKNLQLLGECSNAIEAVEILSQTKIDLIFLDIQMPEITGVEFLKNLDQHPKVIFTTAYREYAIEAFELDVVDYLLKPISLPRFTKAITRFYSRMSNSSGHVAQLNSTQTIPDYIFLKSDKKRHKVLYSDILFFESFGDYLNAYTKKGKITIKERISHLEGQLPRQQFLRVHRGYIISISKISAILPGMIEIEHHKIPIGRSYKQKVELLTK